MSIFDNLFGQRPSNEPPKPGYEHFGGEPADPHNSRYWRSSPHLARIATPSMADYLIEIVRQVRAHAAGIDDATGQFLFRKIEAEANAVGVAVEERYLDQIRTEQGLWADEDALAYAQQLQAEIFKTQLEIADADYRAGKDALLGEPGATPAWNAAISGTRHTPALPRPGITLPGIPVPGTTTTEESARTSASPASETTVLPAEGSGPLAQDHHADTANGLDPSAAHGELDEKAA